MDRIFGEIKRAIEEELAQQESTRRPGQRGPSHRPPVRDIPPEQRWPDDQPTSTHDFGEARDAEDAARMEAERERERERERQRQDPDAHSRARQSETRAAKQAREASRRRERMMQEVTQREDRPRVRRQEEPTRRRSNPLRAFIQQTFRSPDGVRRAILLSEVFGRPVSMRQPDDHLP